MRIAATTLLVVPLLFAADVASLVRSEQARLYQLARVLVWYQTRRSISAGSVATSDTSVRVGYSS